MAKQQRYLSYLLRLWQVGDGEKHAWRASLESPGSRQRRSFASLKDLFSFLEGQVDQLEVECGHGVSVETDAK